MLSTRYSCQILIKLEFSVRISEECSNSMKIRPMGAEFFQADGQTDRHDEANVLFLNLTKASNV